MKSLDIIKDTYPEALTMDGYDDCIIGVCHRFGQEPIVAYNQEKVIKKMMKSAKVSREEAEEFYDFNQLGSWVGEHTPCFIERL